MSRYSVRVTIASAEQAGVPWKGSDTAFGARLALVRQRMGWGNVKEAAIACGIPVESWRSWERDGVMPQGGRYFGICAQIAAATGCDYGWLVDRRPSMSSLPSSQKLARNLTPITGGGRRTHGQIPMLAPV